MVETHWAAFFVGAIVGAVLFFAIIASVIAVSR